MNQCFLSPQNRNEAKWDIRVTQIPCDGSNLLQVNIIIAFEEWTYPFVMTCTLPRLPQAVADTSQPTVAISQVWTGKMELTSSENLCILWTHFIISLIQGTPTLPPVSNRISEPVPFNTISKGKVTFFKTSKDSLSNCWSISILSRMGVGKFTGNKLGYGLACSDHLAFHGEKTGE